MYQDCLRADSHPWRTEGDAWQTWCASLPPLRQGATGGGGFTLRVTVVAAHPADEVLGLGGFLLRLRRAGARVRVVSATDGEATYPGSDTLGPEQLGQIRGQESRDSLALLGIAPAVRLGLRAGKLMEDRDHLTAWLTHNLVAGEVVFSPWRGEGHPDREAAGLATYAAVREAGARLAEYPIHLWRRAWADQPRLRHSQVRRIQLSRNELSLKRAALHRHRSQTVPQEWDLGLHPELPQEALEQVTRQPEMAITRY